MTVLHYTLGFIAGAVLIGSIAASLYFGGIWALGGLLINIVTMCISEAHYRKDF